MNNIDSTIDSDSSNYQDVKNEILFEKDCIKEKKSEGIYQSINYLFCENAINKEDYARLCNDLDLYLDFIIERIDNDKITYFGLRRYRLYVQQVGRNRCRT